MQESPKKASVRSIIGGLALALAIAAAGYFFYAMYQTNAGLTTDRQALQEQLSAAMEELQAASSTIQTLSTELSMTGEALEETREDLEREEERNERFEDQIREITGTVADLDKLSKTDEELLQKYSRVYFLNENYVPSDLDQIDDEYVLEEKDDEYFHANAMEFLEEMIEDAEDDDIELRVASAYRSFDEQVDVKNQHTIVYGEGANTFSADQGYSEHQLGTTVDLTTSELRCICTEFANTEAYEWLLDNAHEYGFTLSYSEGNQFYDFEPWHWRFVGVELAEDLERADASFYDWEQRRIDEYLISIFD